MKYFSVVTAFIFLSVTIYYDVVKHFIGSSFHDERGVIIVPILLLANLFWAYTIIYQFGIINRKNPIWCLYVYVRGRYNGYS